MLCRHIVCRIVLEHNRETRSPRSTRGRAAMKRQHNPVAAHSADGLPRRGFLRAAAGVGVAAGLGPALSACGGSGGSGGAVTLQLWDTDTRPERTANLKKLISMFEAKNPGIRISYLG